LIELFDFQETFLCQELDRRVGKGSQSNQFTGNRNTRCGMKIKLDENFPAQLAEILSSLRHNVDTVADEKLKSQPDFAIWPVTQDSERFLITQDLDF
jgi:hypothetical protein